jgi:outer membrane protein
MKTIAVLVSALSVLLFQEGLSQPRVLTIEESIRTGLENSKMFHSSQMKSEYAEAKASEMQAMLFPSLRVQASFQRLSEVPEFKIPFPGIPTIFPYIANTYVARATFQQPLFTGWRLQGAADNARYQAEAARSDLTRDKAELIYGIKVAYWSVFRAYEIKRLAEESVGQVASHVKDVENMERQGLATMNDVLKAKVQLANSKILQSDAANNVRLATIAFNSMIGLPLETEISIGSPLTPAAQEFPELPDLVRDALVRRPDVGSMESRLKAADAAVTAASGGWFPQIYLTGNYYYSRPNQRIIPLVDRFDDTWDVGVSLQFDLWNNLSTLHQTSQAKAQYEQTRDALGTLKDGITLEVTQSYLSFRQEKERIQLSEMSVQQANENYRMAAAKFKVGLLTSSELLDAEVNLLQAKLMLTQALVDHELAGAKVEKVIGRVP